ncbi:MAG: hypothetical protein WC455_19120 [Dehalococcoidia bacterium]|jgi:hypothetical protein
MTHGRKPNTPPAMAWDRRRYIALVQILAGADTTGPIQALCIAWGVRPTYDRTQEDFGLIQMDMWATIRALAKHAIEYHRAEEEANGHE